MGRHGHNTTPGPRDFDMEDYLRAHHPEDVRVRPHRAQPAPQEYQWVREDGYGSPDFAGVVLGLAQMTIAVVRLIAYGVRHLWKQGR